MDSDEEITWIITPNTVKDRMIESSLTYAFSNSRKYQERTKLLNELLERYRNKNNYKHYVKMKEIVNQKVCVDKEIEDDNSCGEENSKSRKMNLSVMSNSICSNKSLDMSHNKELTPKVLKTKDKSFNSNAPNKILFTDLKSNKKGTKRLRTLQANDENEDTVLVKKKALKNSSKKYLKEIDKTNFVYSKNNSSNSLDAIDSSLLETSGSHSKAIAHSKCNNTLTYDIEGNKEVDNCTSKSKTVENTINKINVHMNNHLNLIDDIKKEILDHSEISEVNNTQQVVLHDANETLPKVENISFDIEINETIIKQENRTFCSDETIIKQENITYCSNETGNSMNLCDIINENPTNVLGSPNIDMSLEKSSPQVTSNEIINKKYKIINKREISDKSPTECFNNTRFVKSSTPLKLSQYFLSQEEEEEEEEERLEEEEYANSQNSNLSILEKRLKQLKNLNLSLESISSSSEDDVPQKKDHSNESTALSKSHCVASTKKTTWSKLKLNRSYNTDHVKSRNVLGTQSNSNSNNRIHSIDFINYDQNDNCSKTLNKCKSRFSTNIVPKIQVLNERSCNLDNFIKEENLVQDTTDSTFVLPDLSVDEDIFLVDVPITVQLANWQHQKIVLKKKKLKIGKNKYEILYKDIPAQSCVFNICQNSKQYKMVNIKPKGSVIVKQKLFS